MKHVLLNLRYFSFTAEVNQEVKIRDVTPDSDDVAPRVTYNPDKPTREEESQEMMQTHVSTSNRRGILRSSNSKRSNRPRTVSAKFLDGEITLSAPESRQSKHSEGQR